MRETLLAPFLLPAKLRKTFGTAKSADAGGPGLSGTVRGCLHSYPHSPDQTSLFRGRTGLSGIILRTEKENSPVPEPSIREQGRQDRNCGFPAPTRIYSKDSP